MHVIVVGLGGMGSAAAYHLAARGVRVTGIERFGAAHDRGSSHGRSRMIRQAYLEGADYVPLLLRAYELWQRLERETGESLLTITGGLMIGPPGSSTVAGSLASARAHGLPYEMLDAAEIRRRFPVMTPGEGVVALYEPRAGYLHPERGVLAHQLRATQLGAVLRFDEPVTAWEAGDRGVRVTTGRGVYEGDCVVLAPGAWAPEVFGELRLPLTVERQVMYWVDPAGGIEPFRRLPVYIWELDDGRQFYGFPADERGMKMSFFYHGSPTTPDTIDRVVTGEELDQLRAVVSTRIPALNAPMLDAITCMYTTTPDHDFVIGLHPRHANVVLASPCSGHGYKFAPVIGEILAELAIERTTRLPIERFAPTRW